MIKSYTILKKGSFIVPQRIDLAEAKEVIYSLICDDFTVESQIIKAINSQEAIEKFHIQLEHQRG